MEQYISKDALLEEIKRLKSADLSHLNGEQTNIYLNTLVLVGAAVCNLEVKEVDLKKEVNAYMDNEMKFLSDEVGPDTLLTIAKHFFELGLKARKGEKV